MNGDDGLRLWKFGREVDKLRGREYLVGPEMRLSKTLVPGLLLRSKVGGYGFDKGAISIKASDPMQGTWKSGLTTSGQSFRSLFTSAEIPINTNYRILAGASVVGSQCSIALGGYLNGVGFTSSISGSNRDSMRFSHVLTAVVGGFSAGFRLNHDGEKINPFDSALEYEGEYVEKYHGGQDLSRKFGIGLQTFNTMKSLRGEVWANLMMRESSKDSGTVGTMIEYDRVYGALKTGVLFSTSQVVGRNFRLQVNLKAFTDGEAGWSLSGKSVSSSSYTDSCKLQFSCIGNVLHCSAPKFGFGFSIGDP